MAAARDFLDAIWRAAGGEPGASDRVDIVGTGDLPSVFAVSDLAAASVGAAALAVAEFIGTAATTQPAVTVDRRLASLWYGFSLKPLGWSLPPVWDAVAGDYEAADGWIRLHTNVPPHRAAALAVLGALGDRDAVANAVSAWRKDELEAEIVAQGGCAAAMRSGAAWAGHPQGRAVAAEPLVHLETNDRSPVPLRNPDPERPLAGIRVLDLTRVLAGPVATRFLAGFGAEVLRIDPPDWEEPAVVPDVTLGKRCARLDLRQEAARDRLAELLAGADVIVHGYRPGALDGLGFDATARGHLRPGLIDVSLDAYGWTGPWADRRGFDSLVQMSTGIAEEGMQRLGSVRPTPLPVQALDHATGYLMAAVAVHGLTDRLKTGMGTRARVSLARTAYLLTAQPAPAGAAPLAPAGDADFGADEEATAFGPALRLRPPVSVAGAPMAWNRPASDLGTSDARWPSPG